MVLVLCAVFLRDCSGKKIIMLTQSSKLMRDNLMRSVPKQCVCSKAGFVPLLSHARKVL